MDIKQSWHQPFTLAIYHPLGISAVQVWAASDNVSLGNGNILYNGRFPVVKDLGIFDQCVNLCHARIHGSRLFFSSTTQLASGTQHRQKPLSRAIFVFLVYYTLENFLKYCTNQNLRSSAQ
jgi:hypothetical protein